MSKQKKDPRIARVAEIHALKKAVTLLECACDILCEIDDEVVADIYGGVACSMVDLEVLVENREAADV